MTHARSHPKTIGLDLRHRQRPHQNIPKRKRRKTTLSPVKRARKVPSTSPSRRWRRETKPRQNSTEPGWNHLELISQCDRTLTIPSADPDRNTAIIEGTIEPALSLPEDQPHPLPQESPEPAPSEDLLILPDHLFRRPLVVEGTKYRLWIHGSRFVESVTVRQAHAQGDLLQWIQQSGVRLGCSAFTPQSLGSVCNPNGTCGLQFGALVASCGSQYPDHLPPDSYFQTTDINCSGKYYTIELTIRPSPHKSEPKPWAQYGGSKDCRTTPL